MKDKIVETFEKYVHEYVCSTTEHEEYTVFQQMITFIIALELCGENLYAETCKVKLAAVRDMS